jgi:hypothetical protein
METCKDGEQNNVGEGAATKIATATKTAISSKRRKPPLGWLLQITHFYDVYGS